MTYLHVLCCYISTGIFTNIWIWICVCISSAIGSRHSLGYLEKSVNLTGLERGRRVRPTWRTTYGDWPVIVPTVSAHWGFKREALKSGLPYTWKLNESFAFFGSDFSEFSVCNCVQFTTTYYMHVVLHTILLNFVLYYVCMY